MADRVKSKVWLYFNRDSASKAVCNYCILKVIVNDSNMTNLHKRLMHHEIEVNKQSSSPTYNNNKRRHDETESNCDADCEKPTTTLTQLWTKLTSTSCRHKQMSNAIAQYITPDMKPLNSSVVNLYENL